MAIKERINYKYSNNIFRIIKREMLVIAMPAYLLNTETVLRFNFERKRLVNKHNIVHHKKDPTATPNIRAIEDPMVSDTATQKLAKIEKKMIIVAGLSNDTNIIEM